MSESQTDILCLENWKITRNSEEETQFTISAQFIDKVSNCKFCRSDRAELQKNGKSKKKVRDSPVRGKHVIILLTIQQYKCKKCNKFFTPTVDAIADKMRITNRLSQYIQDQISEKTFLQISKETGVCVSTIREILVNLSGKIQKNYLPEISDTIGVDEVYVGRKARGIITDIKARRFIELLPQRRCDHIQAFLLQMRNKEKIKFVIIDMHRPYKIAVKKILPHAKVVIDKFHVQRMGNQAINKYLSHLRNSVNSKDKDKDKYLQDRFLLYKRYYNLSEESRQKLRGWIQAVPEIGIIYTLKEKFLLIWSARNKRSAKIRYSKWKSSIPESLLFAFRDILRAFKNWHEEIFNYFDCRLTNAFTESLNSIVKFIVRTSKGCSFEVIRAKLICRNWLMKPKVKKKQR